MRSNSETIRENVRQVLARIAEAAQRSARSPEDVALVAVTKYVDAEVVDQLAAAGLNVFGESRPQILWNKHDALNDRGYEWHLIGHLQRNKVRRTLPLVSMIHSVDSLRLLKEIAKESQNLNLVTRVLLEVNISGEDAKHGLLDADLRQLVDFSLASDSIQVCGLMGMGGLDCGESKTRRQFSSLREMLDRLSNEYQATSARLQHLSMGMSGDFEWAIEEGATMVRIGSVLYEGTR